MSTFFSDGDGGGCCGQNSDGGDAPTSDTPASDAPATPAEGGGDAPAA